MEEKIFDIDELTGTVFLSCAACMSVYADALSWANANKERIVKDPALADNIIVLSCQVTDLAVLSDIRTLENYMKKYVGKKYFISGCLAKRLDVKLEEGVQRLECPRKFYQPIEDKSLVKFEKPFWITNFEETEEQLASGNIFRNMYPLRIGKGCPFNCSYCTIRITRGKFAECYSNKLEEEFLRFEDVLLTADSPMINQIKEWHDIAIKHNKPFSIRNVEPSIVCGCRNEFLNLAKKGLLKIFHSPIQSDNEAVLKDMNRNVKDTFETIELARELKKYGVVIATNIIIDYKNFVQDFSRIMDLYDYVSWNPLWDGKWDRKKAEERFEKYIISKGVELN
ncbi:radical SAM protein [archaeon]|nr:radical SAM protein [archaeon]